MSVAKMIKFSPYSNIFYNAWKLDPFRSDYNLIIDQELFGQIDPARLHRALKRIGEDYLLLHSKIKEENNEYFWVEDKKLMLSLDYFESNLTKSELAKYLHKPFDLKNGNIIRFGLIKLADRHFRFFIVMQHIIMDAVKADPFIDTISKYYNNENYNNPINIEEQRKKISALGEFFESKLKENQKPHKDFWFEKLKKINGVDLSFLKPAFDYTYTKEIKDNIAEYKFKFNSEIFKQLQKLKRKYLITPYLFSQIVFSVLLHRITGQDKIGISYPLAIAEGADFIYGAHININVIPYEFTANMKINSLIEEVKKFFKEIKSGEHQYYLIQNDLSSAKDHNILDLIFSQTNLNHKHFSFENLTKVNAVNENIDLFGKLSFLQEIKNEVVNYRVRINKQYIDQKLLLNFIKMYQSLFIEILADLLVNDGNTDISKYNIISSKQQHLLLKWSGREKRYPKNKLIHQLFEKQVSKTPQNIAVIYEKKELTYLELNIKANQLANYLKNHYIIKPDTPIALCLERDEHVLVAIFAILKAGGAYVPIDSTYPDDRVTYMLEDTQTKILLTNKLNSNRFKNIGTTQNIQILNLDDKELLKKIRKCSKKNLKNIIKSENLAYIIYTSGTTGRPKGVMIEHKNVVSCIAGFVNFPLKKNNNLNMLSTTNYTFDIFGLEYLLPLLNGYKVELVNLNKPICKVNLYNFNFIQITPSKLELLLECIDYGALKNKVHKLIILIGGEPLKWKVLSRLARLRQYLCKGKQQIHFEIINVYGPTETTIWSTAAHLRYSGGGEGAIKISIGKPLYNEIVHVLDKRQELLPIGAIGELYIGGDGVARGYLNQPDLTAKQFINNPFPSRGEKKQSESNKLYKTGDLVRWLPDGNLEYIGRNDSQIKIRGCRVELGEIEAKLSNYSGLKEVAIVAKEVLDANGDQIGDRYLIAYYTANSKINEVKLRSYLLRQLPEYMLPNVFIHISKMPITSNGKLDRKSLSDLELKNKAFYKAPANKQEQLICEAFAKVLNLDKVSVNADFFKLGGSSLKAITLVSNLQTSFNISIADIFNLRTASKIAKNIPFEKNVLKQRLQQIKQVYLTKKNVNNKRNKQLEIKKKAYLTSLKGLKVDHEQKTIRSVLLTGATGYLGCNILNQLLETTNYKVFLLIRAESREEAFERINKKIKFYFDKTLEKFLNLRLFIFTGDIEKSNLDLSEIEYQKLSTQIDSIIHSAALTKHYGEYKKFYSANVQGTIHLLELAKLSELKDFHYISTASVLNEGYIPNCDKYLFTEDDMAENLKGRPNLYVKTKYEAEREVLKYRELGVNANIYRVGNLAFISSNYRVQENIEDNAFFNRIRCLLNLKIIAQEIGIEEISPVDFTAQALIKLFDKKQLSNSIYHLFNPALCNMAKFLSEEKYFSVNIIPINQFIDIVMRHLDNPLYQKLIERFLLHQGWLEEKSNLTDIQISQDRTSAILKQLGFHWLKINKNIFKAFIMKAYLL